MFYTLALMLIFAVILLIFDHESRYSQLFVLMSVGAAVAFFFIILQINMFASYGYHIDDSIYYWLNQADLPVDHRGSLHSDLCQYQNGQCGYLSVSSGRNDLQLCV